MTSLRLRATVALALAAFTAACGGGDGTGPSFADSVSTADALDFADLAADAAGQMAYQMNFGSASIGLAAPAAVRRLSAKGFLATKSLGGRTLLPAANVIDWRSAAANPSGLQASAGEGCTYSFHGIQLGGGFVDVNQNGIPDDVLIRIDCIQTDSISNPDTNYIHRQFQEQTIKENFSSMYGYTATVKVEEKYSDEFGNWEGYDVHGTETLDIRSGSAAHKYDFTYHEGGKFGAESADYVGGTSWDGAFDPDSPISLAADLPDGQLSFSGREYFTDTESNNLSFALHTTTPLAYDAACASADTNPPFSAGVIRGDLNANASQAHFTVTFTSCGNYDVAVNGTYDEPVVVSARP